MCPGSCTELPPTCLRVAPGGTSIWVGRLGPVHGGASGSGFGGKHWGARVVLEEEGGPNYV